MSTLLDELRSMKLVKVMTFTNRETGEREEKQVVLYDGLLHAARQIGLTRIETDLVLAPNEENRWTAVVQARVETKTGTYSGIGDATPENVNRRVSPAFIRVAETRAKARALRDAVDLRGVLCLDEIDDLQDEGERPPRRAPAVPNGRGPGNGAPRNGNGHGNGAPRAPQRNGTPPGPNRLPQGNGSNGGPPREREGPRPMSEKQFGFLMKLMADEGFDREAAIEQLKSSFGTGDLRTVTATQASAKIDELTGKAVAGRTYG
ncbi:MAG: hypothetical protein M9894_00530 [Planctomycetes bacterium]|nr:hypothetical protein [Planctomycetota bacterium]